MNKCEFGIAQVGVNGERRNVSITTLLRFPLAHKARQIIVTGRHIKVRDAVGTLVSKAKCGQAAAQATIAGNRNVCGNVQTGPLIDAHLSARRYHFRIR